MQSGIAIQVIKCPFCGGHEIEVKSRLSWDAVVYCCVCGNALCNWKDFLKRVREVITGAAQHTGFAERAAALKAASRRRS